MFFAILQQIYKPIVRKRKRVSVSSMSVFKFKEKKDGRV